MILRKLISVFALVAACMFGAASANAKTFYISGSSSRTTGGTSCSDALSVAWFNNSSSWGTASHQISAGTTVFLCGTFTGKPGQQLLTVRGSGSSSSPIIIKFLTGAVLSAPYWSGNGAIHMDGMSYIIVDGGTNGIIQNTANGTGRAYRQQSVAVHATSCNHCTVQNLNIQNLYVRTSSSDLAATHTVHCVYWHLANYMTVNHITCHDASWAIAGDGSNFTLENSNIYHIDHGVAAGTTGKVGGFSIHNNHFHDYANWDSPTNTYHHDGIHLWGQNGGTITSGQIYANTFDGDSGRNITAHVFLQDSVQHVSVYNNIFVTPTTRTIQSVEVYASSTSLPGGSATNNSVYNNSINAGGHGQGSAIWVNNQLLFTAVNNILSGGVGDISVQGGTRSSTGINNNVYRDLFAEFGDRNTFGMNGKTYYTLSSWRSACHCDSGSKLILSSQTTAFSSTTLASGTTVSGAGVTASGVQVSDTTSTDPSEPADVNMAVVSSPTTSDQEFELLTTVGEGNGINLSEIAVGDLAPLAFDKNGKPRPAAGPWNVGPF